MHDDHGDLGDDDEPAFVFDGETLDRARYGDFYEASDDRLAVLEHRAHATFPQMIDPAFRHDLPAVRLLCPSHGGTVETVTLDLDPDGGLALLRVPRRGRSFRPLTPADPLGYGTHVQISCRMRRCAYAASHRLERLIALYLVACQRGSDSIALPS
jgi:hypothetical protein